ncbi:hypothetical protein [Ruegeria sp. EL01]|jgi:hypothetical protein|uniref:hypothetical protein n=1 Tax=Ruegeria sp. EL01 TaxID=2107578 RepID=UPI000EA8345B|nr:hypothetical protein [Ruegeria sp. EL01]
MKTQENSLPTRRDALTMIAASAVVLVTPIQALAKPETKIVVTVTRFGGHLTDQRIKTITARRAQQGFLSQKVLGNEDSVVLIEEWRKPMVRGTETYSRKEI